MLKTGKTYFKKLTMFLPQHFLKYIWLFFNIMHESVNSVMTEVSII